MAAPYGSSISGIAYAVDSVSNRVVGTLLLPNGNAYACYWDKIVSSWSGPFFLVDQPSVARAVDAQGVIAGHTTLQAFSYQGSFTLLSNPLGNFPSRALGITVLDNLIVGGIQNASGVEYPVYWLNGTPQVLPGGPGVANGISPDGSVIVGQTNQRAAAWIDGNWVSVSNTTPSEATDASFLGQTIVGRIISSGFAYQDGIVTLLQPLSGHSSSRANAIDAYAQTIVGSSNATHATMWIRQPNGDWGVIDLNILCQADLAPNDRLVAAQSVSLDGRFIVGFGVRAATNRIEPFIIDLSTCRPTLGDVNLDGIVDDADLIIALFDYGNAGEADLNNDGIVDDSDLLTILFNFGNQQICSNCCEATWLLYNTRSDVARIVLSPNDPSAIQSVFVEDADDAWQVRRQGNTIVITHESGTIPSVAEEMQDEILHVRLSQNASFTVDWYDVNGNRIKSERVSAPCVPNTDMDEESPSQWQINRELLSGISDEEAFCGFVPAPCDPDEHDLESRVGTVDFEWSVACSSNTLQLNLEVTNPDPETHYSWNIDVDGQKSTPSGSPLALVIPTNARNIKVQLNASKRSTDGTVQQTSSPERFICLPTADFEASPATPVCDSNGNITGYKVRVTPTGVCPAGSEVVEIPRYSWSYGTSSVNGTGVPQETELILPPTATGSQQIRLSLQLDNCTRTSTQTVQVLNPCAPRFRVKYVLCNTNCATAGDTVPVTFVCTNINRNDCTTYEWSFGGGSWITNNSEIVTHTVNLNKYDLWNQDCTPRERSYAIRLRATNRSCPSGVIYTLNFTVRPVRGKIRVTVCPDGETDFEPLENNMVEWSNGANLPTKWQVEAFIANNRPNRRFKYKLDNGNYTVIARFTDSQDADPATEGVEVVGECVQSHSFAVQKECCDKFKSKGHQNFTHAGKNYRIYYKHKEKERRLIGDFKIVAKTKLKRERSIRGITYYTWSRADEVSVQVVSNLRSSGTINQTTCDCVTPVSNTFNEQRSRSSKVKLRKNFQKGLGIHKDDSLCSIHRVKIGGFETFVRVHKPAGALCDGVQISGDSSCP